MIITVQEPVPDSTDSSDDEMSVSTESRIPDPQSNAIFEILVFTKQSLK